MMVLFFSLLPQQSARKRDPRLEPHATELAESKSSAGACGPLSFLPAPSYAVLGLDPHPDDLMKRVDPKPAGIKGKDLVNLSGADTMRRPGPPETRQH
jgi:hypothetical protein